MKRIVLVAALLLAGGEAGYAQSAITSDAALIAKTQAFANEVFQNCPLFAGPQYITDYAEYVSRVSVVTETYSPSEQYPLLSAILLKDKCNPQMQRDELNFNPANFNPLKYFFNYYPRVITKYRVDNSNYVIVIQPRQ